MPVDIDLSFNYHHFMTKHFYLLSILFLVPFFTGCQESEKKSLRNVKVSEIVDKQQQAENKNMTVSLHIYMFRIDANNLDEIQYQIEQTDTPALKFQDSDSFTANGLAGCGGDGKSWQKTGPLIEEAKPKTKKHIKLLIDDNLSNDVVAAETKKPVSIIYRSDETMSGIGFEPGQMVLRLKVSPLIGLRQACRLDVTPVYKITGTGQKKSQSPEKIREYSFDSASLNARLRPGQYILLAPANEKQKQTEAQTIGNIVFYNQTAENTADLYLIACESVNSPL